MYESTYIYIYVPDGAFSHWSGLSMLMQSWKNRA